MNQLDKAYYLYLDVIKLGTNTLSTARPFSFNYVLNEVELQSLIIALDDLDIDLGNLCFQIKALRDECIKEVYNIRKAKEELN